MKVFRSPDNPIIKPKDVKPSRRDFEVIGVFNAGVARFEGEVILLLRVAERPISVHPDITLVAIYDANEGNIVLEKFLKNDPNNDFSDPRFVKTKTKKYLTSISHLRLARSKDGIKFEIEDAPAIGPGNNCETFGVEDPRISLIGGTYYISYVSVSPAGITTSLASTKDFSSFERHGVIFCPENKDVVIFDEKFGDKYYALHRPVSAEFNKCDIWIAESPDLFCWGNHRYLMGPRPSEGRGYWDGARIGASTVPFKIEQGWVEIYHGADRSSRYCLGAAMLDAKEPWKVIARTEKPIFEPQADYEIKGFFGNVIFTCGLLCEDDRLKIYYGACDAAICYAELSLKDILVSLNL